MQIGINCICMYLCQQDRKHHRFDIWYSISCLLAWYRMTNTHSIRCLPISTTFCSLHSSLLYLIQLIWRIKKYDWSREVTWRENKSSCFPPDVVFPFRVSRHNALRCITSCYWNSFRYNKQLLAQLVWRHEDLSHPENSCLPRASPSGDMNFQGGTNLRVSLQTGQ